MIALLLILATLGALDLLYRVSLHAFGLDGGAS